MSAHLRWGAHEAVLSALGEGVEPVLHPEGFAQIALDPPNGDWKVHVWDARLPRLADPDVLHDHIWDMTSTVLCGEQRNILFTRPTWRQLTGLNKTLPGELYDLYRARPIRHSASQPGAGGKVLEKMYGIRLIEQPPVVVKAGETYSMKRFEFHRSEALPGTATLMHKTRRAKRRMPSVCAAPGQSPDNMTSPNRRPSITPEFLADVMLDVLRNG